MAEMVERLHKIVEALLGYRYTFANEAELQAGIEAALKAEGIAYDREHRFARGDRVDFFIENIGLEVKIDSSVTEITRQLQGYAKDETVKGLILVTSRAKHRAIPTEIAGIPIVLACLAEGAL